MSISLDNKGTIPVSCTAHDVAPHWSPTPPKEQSAIVKLPSNFLHLADKTYLRNERRMGTQPSPHSLLCPSWYIISMLSLVLLFCLHQKLFGLLCSSPNSTCVFLRNGWFHLLRSKGVWNNGSHRPVDTAINCSSMLVICLFMLGHAPLLVGIYKIYAGC